MTMDEEDFCFRKASVPEGEAVTFEEAEEFLLRQLQERGGTCRKTLWQLARLYSMMGRQSEAVSYVQKLLQLSDDIEENASYFLALGQLMEQMGDFASAAEYYRGGLLLKTSNSATRYWLNNNLGFCLNEFGRYDEAEGYLLAAVKMAPRMSNAYKNLALCHQGKGDYTRAAKGFIIALKRNASDARPLKHLEDLLKEHRDVLCEIPNLPGQIEICRKAVEGARQAQPDFKKHWRKLRRRQRGEVSTDTAH
jgi:tetratricopeptide (TPR) repeat protein